MFQTPRGYVYSGRKNDSLIQHWGPGVRTCYILHYVIKGQGTFVCNGKAYSISVGESFLIRPFEKVEYYANENDPWSYVWLDFNGDDYATVLQKSIFCKGNCVIGKILPEQILPYFELLQKTSYPANKNAASNLALALLGKYVDIFSSHSTPKKAAYYSAACSLIATDFHKQDLNLIKICQKLHISRATLHREFIAACGMAPGSYLLKYRLEQAQFFLKAGLSIKETAYSCGFADPLYFSKVFKVHVGLAPSNFKNH